MQRAKWEGIVMAATAFVPRLQAEGMAAPSETEEVARSVWLGLAKRGQPLPLSENELRGAIHAALEGESFAVRDQVADWIVSHPARRLSELVGAFETLEDYNQHSENCLMAAMFSGDTLARAYAQASLDIWQAVGHLPEGAQVLRRMAYAQAWQAIKRTYGEGVAITLLGEERHNTAD